MRVDVEQREANQEVTPPPTGHMSNLRAYQCNLQEMDKNTHQELTAAIAELNQMTANLEQALTDRPFAEHREIKRQLAQVKAAKARKEQTAKRVLEDLAVRIEGRKTDPRAGIKLAAHQHTYLSDSSSEDEAEEEATAKAQDDAEEDIEVHVPIKLWSSA